MRETMENMEQERAEMVAEVEAQIEKALASMAVDIDDSDEDEDEDESRPASRSSSRPGSRMSRSNSRASRSRRASDAGSRMKQLRSFGTESTLVEPHDHVKEEPQAKLDLTKGAVIEEEEENPISPTTTKRFSATGVEGQQDGMTAVDEGISERSDRIAQKVLQIQQKVRSSFIVSRLTPMLTVTPVGECARVGP